MKALPALDQGRIRFRIEAARVPDRWLRSFVAGCWFAVVVISHMAIPRYIPVMILASGVALIVLLGVLSQQRFGGYSRFPVMLLSSIGLLVSIRFFPFFFFSSGVKATTIVFILLFQLNLILHAGIPCSFTSIGETLSLPIVLASTVLFYSRVQGEPAWFAAMVIFVTGMLAALYHQIIGTSAARMELDASNHMLNRLNRRLATATANLLEQKQQRHLASLSASIAHEIKNPINHMLGNLELLKRDLRHTRSAVAADRAESSRRNEVVEGIESGARVILEVVDRIQGLFRPAGSAPVQINLSKLWRTVEAATVSSESSQRSVEVKIDPDVQVMGYPGDLYVILANLFRNAVEATLEDGSIRISAQRVGAELEIEIRDNGVGMSPEVLEHAFDPFFTTKEDRGGLGVGLALCRDLLTKMHGSVRVESELGEGTRFIVTIPEALP